jgi:choline-sulfatase
MPQSRPNIVLIMSDQHHPRFMGCAGEPILKTPHLDALAARGTRFSHAYCNFPLCCPSRMSFMTARYPSDIRCVTNHAQLNSDIPTFAHAFNAAGYETVLCGRMHFNGPDQRHGFQKRLVSDVTKAYARPGEELERVLGPVLCRTTGPSANAISTSGPGYSGYQAYDETVSARAADWLRDRDRTPSTPPFLLVVGLVMPHAPFVATPDDYDAYEAQISLDDLPQPHSATLHPALRDHERRSQADGAFLPLEDQRRARIAYYGMCAHVDRLVGRVLDALCEAGLDEDTLVVYTSDHGEQLGEHGMWWKHTFYESSVGVPLLMAGPGVPRGVVENNVSLLDIGPTLLDMVDAPSLPAASGRSFRCLLEGRQNDWHDTVIAENLWGASALERMIKHGDWKLCHYPGQGTQLFNLREDPREMHDRSADPNCRAIRQELLNELQADWDEAAFTAWMEDYLTIAGWTQQWRMQCDLPEPDAPWYDEPPLNQLRT